MSITSDLKSVFNHFNESFTQKRFDLIEEKLDEEASTEVFNTSTGEYLEIHGKTSVMETIIHSWGGDNDMRLETDLVLQDDNFVIAFGYVRGTKWNRLLDPKGFEIKTTVLFTFKGGIVFRMAFYFDTFHFMKIMGTAIMNQKDDVLTRNYLQLLITTGIISEEMIKIGKSA
ncbi:MAG: nuclear transport factor 2 family protein [Candidatus Kariarchaeaceae archaeon]|jgi:hypothetical protein